LQFFIIKILQIFIAKNFPIFTTTILAAFTKTLQKISQVFFLKFKTKILQIFV